jgi:hypothetical protein
MEAAYATDVPDVILLKLLAFSIASLFCGDVYCPMRTKTFIDHAAHNLRGFYCSNKNLQRSGNLSW